MKIILTVTNDLNYDQRMHRICRSLVQAGHDVELIGRRLPHSIPLTDREFRQTRLHCFFLRGFPFYAEYNLRLFCFLLFQRNHDAIGVVDLDTLAAGFLAAILRRKKKVFDAHEYFTEVPEVVHRPVVKAFWGGLARILLPSFRHCYTVGPALAEIFSKKYGVAFQVVRNMPEKTISSCTTPAGNRILYQGALNEGRGIAEMLLAMQSIENVHLVLYGEGDLSEFLREKAAASGLGDKVHFEGYATPETLKQETNKAWLGINLLENRGLSYYYSLANKFFDYVQAGVPVLTMDFPEYRTLNEEFEVAILLPDLLPATIASAVQQLINEPATWQRLHANCLRAREVWNWESEQRQLLAVWNQL